MSLFSWLFGQITGRPPARRAPACRLAPRFRPQLEALEERYVPSTLTVTTTADSGAGSLRADIAAAQSGDTINFSSSLAGQTITLTSGELVLNKSLTIQGLGAGELTISGGNASRVFEVDGAATNVSLSGLTITQGNAQSGDGGGIFNNGSTLSASGCAVTDSTGTAGGGIYNTGKLTLSGCTVSGNTTQEWGGGIYNYVGTLSITNSTLSGNSAVGSDGGDSFNNGGGLYNWEGVVTMSGCTLSDNSAADEGGAVYTYAAVTTTVTGKKPHTVVNTVVTGSLTMTGCTVTGNSAQLGGGYYDASSSAAALTISNSAFSDNSCMYGTSSTYGGYIYYGPGTNGGGNTYTFA